MLSKRSLIYLAAAVVVLLGINVLQRTSHQRATSRSDTTHLLPAELQAEDLTRVTLGFGADTSAVVLEHLPDKWVVRTAFGHPASTQRIDELIRNLTGLQGEFRSDDPAVLVDYGLADSAAVWITVFGKDWQPVGSLLIGKRPSGAVGNFARRPGGNDVYLTRTGILGSIGIYGEPQAPQSRHFLELQAYKTERNDVDAITLHDGGKTIELAKVITPPATPPAPAAGDTTAAVPAEPDRSVYEWKMVQPKAKPALKTKADAVLGAAALVRAVDVADPNGDLMAYGLWRAERKIELRFKDGKTFTLFFGATRPEAGGTGGAPGGVYMRTDADNTIWVVRESLLGSLFPKLEDLLAAS